MVVMAEAPVAKVETLVEPPSLELAAGAPEDMLELVVQAVTAEQLAMPALVAPGAAAEVVVEYTGAAAEVV
jgi:hypothetical protein